MRCCADSPLYSKSSKTCAQLGWNPDHDPLIRTDSDDVCGASLLPLRPTDLRPPDVGENATYCLKDRSWDDSTVICAAIGARLCSVSEIKNGEARNTGCGINNLAVWTFEECGPGEAFQGTVNEWVVGGHCELFCISLLFSFFFFSP